MSGFELLASKWYTSVMENVEIYLLKPAEWPVYKTIQLEALKEDPQAFGANYSESVDFSDDKWQERPSNKDSLIFVAKDEETPIGLVGIHFENDQDERVAHIWGMYISSNYRGMGLGKKLINKALDTVKKTQVKKVKLMVECEPTPAQMLYKSLGFEISGTTDYKLGDGKQHKLYKMEMLLEE